MNRCFRLQETYEHCEICGEWIEGGRKIDLQIHARLKHDGKRYKCHLCHDVEGPLPRNAVFKQKDALLHHQMREHNLEPRAKCKVQL